MYSNVQNPFELLGIDPTFDVDMDALNEAYFTRQSISHPDRFVFHAEPERQAAIIQSSALNNAYETLKNPTSRAQVLLKMRGIAIDGEDGQTTQHPQILGEMMDIQEALGSSTTPDELSKVESQIREKLQEVQKSFAQALQKNDHTDLKDLFLRMTYLSKLLSDLITRQRQSSVKIL
jgi:molecular chaperone HscB